LISDIGLPDRSGYELMKEMRGRGVPGIALSGFGMEHDVNRAVLPILRTPNQADQLRRLEEVIRQLLSNSVEKQ